MSNDNANDVMH